MKIRFFSTLALSVASLSAFTSGSRADTGIQANTPVLCPTPTVVANGANFVLAQNGSGPTSNAIPQGSPLSNQISSQVSATDVGWAMVQNYEDQGTANMPAADTYTNISIQPTSPGVAPTIAPAFAYPLNGWGNNNWNATCVYKVTGGTVSYSNNTAAGTPNPKNSSLFTLLLGWMTYPANTTCAQTVAGSPLGLVCGSSWGSAASVASLASTVGQPGSAAAAAASGSSISATLSAPSAAPSAGSAGGGSSAARKGSKVTQKVVIKKDVTEKVTKKGATEKVVKKVTKRVTKEVA